MPSKIGSEAQLRLEALNQAVGASSSLGLGAPEEILNVAHKFEQYLKEGRGKVARSDNDQRGKVGRA